MWKSTLVKDPLSYLGDYLIIALNKNKKNYHGQNGDLFKKFKGLILYLAHFQKNRGEKKEKTKQLKILNVTIYNKGS